MKNDYLKVKESIKNKILFGKYQAEEKLPTENELIEQFKISRYSIRRALGELEREHLIYRVQGSGMFVQSLTKKWTKNTSNKTIGIICTHIASYIFPQIIDEIDNILTAHGYSLLLSNTHNDPTRERQSLINMLDSQVAGIIIEPSQSSLSSPNMDIFNIIKKKEIPIVFLNAVYESLDFPCVSIDDLQGENHLTSHLLELGHRQILGVFQTNDLQGVNRMRGFMKAFQERKIDNSNCDVIMYSPHDDFDIIAQKVELYLKSPTPPTAIICYNDQLAIWLTDYLKKNCYHIPDDISIVGFDNYAMAQYLTPPLTTTAYPTRDIGQAAGEGILALINNGEFSSKKYEPKLILRKSTQKI